MTKNRLYDEFGYEKFGPFLYGFTEWLRKNLKKSGHSKVFFLSRDGYMMEKANEIFQTTDKMECEFEYIYFSRNSLRHALLWTAESYEDSFRYLTYSKYIPFAEIVSYYGLEKEDIEKNLAWKDKWDQDIAFEHLRQDQEVKNLYETFSEEIKVRSREQYQLIIKYFDQICFFQDDVAIVDIGWHGTMQAYLEELVKVAGKSTKVTGYYVGIHADQRVSGPVRGYMYEDGLSRKRKELLCFFGVVEKFFQSQEGSAKGYQEIKGKIVPTQEEYEYQDDADVVKILQSLQSGALRYVKDEDQKKTGDADMKKYEKPLLRFGKYPTLKETRLFRFLYNTDGMKVYFLPQKPLMKYGLKEFMHALSNSCWKTGFLKEAFKLPLPYYYVYELLRK